jgi:hypothetical protein
MKKLLFSFVLLLFLISSISCDNRAKNKIIDRTTSVLLDGQEKNSPSTKSSSGSSFLQSIPEANEQVLNAFRIVSIDALSEVYNFLNVNDDISSIRLAIYSAALQKHDLMALNLIRDALLSPPIIHHNDRAFNMVAQLIHIGELYRQDGDNDDGVLTLNLIAGRLNNNFNTNMDLIDRLVNTIDLFYQYGQILNAIENNNGVIDLNVLIDQLGSASLIVAQINTYDAGADIVNVYNAILFVNYMAIAIRDRDIDTINVSIRQLKSNNPDILGDLTNGLYDDDRNILIDAMNRLYSTA